MGPNEKGGIDMDIPGVSYEIIGTSKFSFLPKGKKYRVTGDATGLGHFDVRIKTIEHDKVVSEAYYDNLSIGSLKTNIEIKIAKDGPDYNIKLDKSGDKQFETAISPSAILNQEEAGDKEKPITKATIKDGKLELSATDDNAGVLKIEYSLDDGKTWIIYDKPINPAKEINNKQILYRATDRAGNIEINNKRRIEKDVIHNKYKLSDVGK